MRGVLTTLVGSFPLDATLENFERALVDQVEVGIDIPVLPQLRDFVEMYIDPLLESGSVVKERRGFVLKGSISRYETKIPHEILYTADKASEMGVEYRLAFTGPFTIASKIAVTVSRSGDFFNSILKERRLFEELLVYVEDMADEIRRNVKPKIVCVDEPILSVIVGSRKILFDYSIEYIREVLDRILSKFSGAEYRGVHICSRLPPLLKEILLNLENANFLDHEHHDVVANRRYYTREELLNNSKKLAYGIISSKKPEIEDYEEAMKLAQDALQNYKETLIFLKPDCGFGGLKNYLQGKEYKEIVIPKLKILTRVAQKLRD